LAIHKSVLIGKTQSVLAVHKSVFVCWARLSNILSKGH
jgi:hypothetical protein